MQSSKKTRVLNSICVLLVAFTGVVRQFRFLYPAYSDNILIFLLFVLAIGIWAGQMRRRLLLPEVRGYLLKMAGLLVFLMICRTVKYVYLPGGAASTRYAWYLYYVPLTLMVLYLFYAVLYVGKPYGTGIHKAWKLLYLPACLLAAGFMSNDLHQLAFRFPAGVAEWDNVPYSYGPLYVAELVWVGGLCAAILVIAVVRCSVSEYRKNIWMPLLPLCVGLVYVGSSFLWPRGNLVRLYKVTELICFVFPAFAEGLLQAHLFPSNDSYEALWQASGLRCGIMNREGGIVCESEKSVQVTEAEVRQAEGQEVFLKNENLVLRSHEITGGYSFWMKDITEINAVNKKLAELGDVITEENAMLEGENRLREKKNRIVQQSRLYREIAEDLEGELKVLSGLLQNPPEEEALFEERMKYAAIYNVYIKRRSNMLLLSSEQPVIAGAELALAIRESMDYVQLAGSRGYFACEGTGQFPGEWVLSAYQLFQRVIEASLPCPAILVHLCLDGTKKCLQLTMELHAPASPVSPDAYPKERERTGAVLFVEREENTEFVRLFIPGEGACL